MYTAEEQTFKMRYAFAQLIRNGITTALPITSMFYREWAETYDEFARSADSAAELGIRAYLGPCYMTGVTVINDDGSFNTHWNEELGLDGLNRAVDYVKNFDGRDGGLIRGMLAPDRIENCTPELLSRSAAASQDLDCPIRLHCCQSREEFDSIVERYDKTPIEWLSSLNFLSKRSLLPHGIFVTGHSSITRGGRDTAIVAKSGATFIHCPLVAARYGATMESFSRFRKRGIPIGLGTDTFPPDMVENMRIGINLCRIAEKDVAACSSADFYNAATIGGADALGRPDLGRLAPGAKADMTLFDLSGFHLGQLVDPIQTMMLSGTGRDFKTSIINGRVVLKDWQLPGVDMDEFRRRAQTQFDSLIEKYPLRTWRHPPVEEIFLPSYPFM
jgi:cytosine/adenosine deaminase-related metal-dependent hydrolase